MSICNLPIPAEMRQETTRQLVQKRGSFVDRDDCNAQNLERHCWRTSKATLTAKSYESQLQLGDQTSVARVLIVIRSQ